MDTPKFKRGERIEYMGSILQVTYVRWSIMAHEWIYTVANIEVAEAALLRAGAKPAKGEA